MTKHLTILLTVMMGACFGAMAQSSPMSKLVFEKQVHDFGQIDEEAGKVSFTFTFKNMGTEPAVITRVTSGCGCIGSEYTKEPVKPGGHGSVTVTYDPWYRPGDFSKEVTVHSSSGRNRIWVKGGVNAFLHPVEEDHPYDYGQGLHMSLKVLAFGRVSKDKPKEIAIKYANDNDKPIELRFEVEGGDGNLQFTDPGKMEAKERGRMYFKYSVRKPFTGQREYKIYPVIDGKKLSEPLNVRVTGME